LQLQLVQKSIESVEQVGGQKAKNLESIGNILNFKMSETNK
jgi:hypothetical protein